MLLKRNQPDAMRVYFGAGMTEFCDIHNKKIYKEVIEETEVDKIFSLKINLNKIGFKNNQNSC
jgi:hypothetical protein